MENFRAWRATVLAQVRFWPDRKDIEKELTAHYEDHVRDLERLDYPWKLAEQRALDAMGDPEEIGKALDRVHKPWLGWLWVASRAVLILALVTALFLGAEPMGQWLHRAKNSFFPPEDLGMYQEELSHYQTINQEAGREVYEVWGTLTGEAVPIGEDYTLSVVKGCWWKYQDQFWQGQCLLRLEPEYFWYDCPEDILDDLTLTLSNGAVLRNESLSLSGRPINGMTSEWFRAYYSDNREPRFGHVGQTHNVSSADLGGWYVMLKFSTREAAQAEWMELSYPAGDWTMRLYWEEAVS